MTTKADPTPSGTTAAAPAVLLAHHLKQLKLPTVLREYEKVAMLGSLDHATRQLIVHTSPTKRSADFIAHLEQLDRLYGPQPGRPTKPVILVEDNGPIHTSNRTLAALAARAHWLTVE